ncbi:bifunctional lysylphosphatidylglycerol flippase/synthetase MprF [Actinophytocola sp.]|uniref:bifunctional lysylphosphatidylglycerol flippase/synthetase MprF n=1 Tax=Actinophytocola sp. TaxID=1872138 RepID=UPI002ED9D32A
MGTSTGGPSEGLIEPNRTAGPVLRRHVWPLGLVTAGFAVVGGLAALRVAPPGWVRPVTHLMSDGPHGRLHGGLLAVALLVLAHGLLRRRKVAYWVALAVAGCGVLLAGRSVLAVLLVAAGVALAVRRSAFPAVPRPARVRFAAVCGLAVLATGGLYDVSVHGHAELRVDLGSLVLLGVSVALVVLLAPAPAPPPADGLTRARVGELVKHPSSDTLAPFVLRHDKSYAFSPDGRAALGYRVLLGVAVVGGDPVGDPAAFPDAVAEFVRMCDRAGWRVSALAVREDIAPLWRRHGLRTVGIGDEVLLDVDRFVLSGRSMRNVRQAVRRTHNLGVTTTVVREGDLAADVRAELARLSARWLGGSQERGFSMILDGLLTGSHPNCVLVIARDHTGRVVGFQRYAPCGEALSLDTMRRDRDALNGLNERMIVDLASYARARAVRVISLNFAAFRALLDAGDDRGVLERVGYQTMHLLDPFIHLESLYQFNAKFRPDFLPRGVAFPSWFSVPVVAAAMVGMEFGLGYDRHRPLDPSLAADRPLTGHAPLRA